MAFLNLVETVVKTKILPGVQDNVLRNSPLLSILRKESLQPDNGGPAWQENFGYDVLNVEAYQPGDTHNISQVQTVTGGTVTPRYYSAAVSAYIEKIRTELVGELAAFDYLASQVEMAGLSMSARLANDAYRHGQNQGTDRTKYINGLAEALSDGSTNGFLGQTYTSYLTVPRSSVNAALNSPMTAPAASITALSQPTLDSAIASVMIGTEKPDTIITTNLGWSLFKNLFNPMQRFEDTTMDGGFLSTRYMGIRVLADQYCPGSRTATSVDTKVGYSAISGESMWILNTKHMRLYLSTDPLFSFGMSGFIPSQDSGQITSIMRFRGNLTVQAPRLSRYLFGFTV